jgi:hypothetical protein
MVTSGLGERRLRQAAVLDEFLAVGEGDHVVGS